MKEYKSEYYAKNREKILEKKRRNRRREKFKKLFENVDDKLSIELFAFFSKHENETIKADTIIQVFPELKHGSTVRKYIHYLRVVFNKPIISDNRGYTYTKDREKLFSCYLSLNNRADKIKEASNAMLETFLKI